jgi:hypothetical protein
LAVLTSPPPAIQFSFTTKQLLPVPSSSPSIQITNSRQQTSIPNQPVPSSNHPSPCSAYNLKEKHHELLFTSHGLTMAVPTSSSISQAKPRSCTRFKSQIQFAMDTTELLSLHPGRAPLVPDAAAAAASSHELLCQLTALFCH